MTDPIYAIGDIHGQLAMLEEALDKIASDGGPDARIVFLGDYVDRGPDCRGVIERLVQGQSEGRNWVTLKGNHDRMFQWFMEDTPRHDPHLLVGFHWFHDLIGGVETMASYGVTFHSQTRLKSIHAAAKEAVPQTHTDFLNALPTSYETDALIFVHAGIRPRLALEDQTEEDLVWIRQSFHAYTDPHPKLVVHGHTPVEQATHYGNRVNLDTGAGYGNPLSVAVFEGTQSWLLTDRGREPLSP
ncbi:metallophosphoesterase family protein [Aestuariivita sp.]|uniref:metallophosphoesterase family protein n=1 Tax=Aestuariivita sp. TaxID=1872407 RepID=UPI0021713782|nr:metallophosphoesterase family protein [Aestuariivita sp.]MCE8006258.1 serine/threonine protein phosphatase [Aestuariivita sp.]